jgi:hypothetical protein
MLGETYPALVGKTGGWYTWKAPDTEYMINIEGVDTPGVIDVAKKFREQDLALLIRYSVQAKEMIRAAFGIPDMPPPEVEEEIEKTNKTKRKRKSELEVDEPLSYTSDDNE